MLADILQQAEPYITTYGPCPSCGGRKSFGVTHTGEKIIYNCFKCQFRGVKHLHITDTMRQQMKARDAVAAFTVPISWLPIDAALDQCMAYMQKTHTLDAYLLGKFKPMYDLAERRFVYPIYDRGLIVGGMGRSLIGSGIKAKNYHSSCLVPFACGQGSRLVLVEDCASAVSVTRLPDTIGMALLGTTLKDSYVPAIKAIKAKTIYVALDADARQKSLTVVRRLANIHPDVRPIFLEKDIKDMPDLTDLLR